MYSDNDTEYKGTSSHHPLDLVCFLASLKLRFDYFAIFFMSLLIVSTRRKIVSLCQTVTIWFQSIGLYRSKARHIVSCCQSLVEKFDGTVPNNRKDLESLAGVGRKTANVVLNTAFNQSTIAVDTHIFRVANRTGIARGKTVLAVE